jgi:lipoprotein-anchoring transpeptidase ErfK/SrfK
MACDVTIKHPDGDEAKQQNQGAAAPPQQPQQSANPQDQANAQSVARARDLALTFGNDQQRAQARDAAQREFENLRFEVDISDRKIRAFNGDKLIGTQPVAVGTKEWPTPTGSWEFHRVDLNPEWIPPKDEKWAEKEKTQAPGSPDNPMGRARLVYRMPNTVHGTNDVASLGKASSHGSIRVANEVVLRLAQTLLKAGGAWEGQPWFDHMAKNQTQEYQIDLKKRIPIKVQE